MYDGKVEGFWDVKPEIKDISFPLAEKMQVEFEDGRCLLFPISKFPNINKMTAEQRNNWYLLGDGFSFEDCNEVYHVEQLFGNYQTYRHEA